MAYYRQNETARRLEDWRRWSPELRSGMGGCSMWNERVDSSGYRIAPIPVMRGEAADTHAALGRMVHQERDALVEYHTAPTSTSATQQARRLKISYAEYNRRLLSAHMSFWRELEGMVDAARRAHESNVATSKTASQSRARLNCEPVVLVRNRPETQ